MQVLSMGTSQSALPLVTDGSSLSIGQLCYYQTGIFGSPLGLLLSLTITPQIYQAIKTASGLQRIQ